MIVINNIFTVYLCFKLGITTQSRHFPGGTIKNDTINMKRDLIKIKYNVMGVNIQIKRSNFQLPAPLRKNLTIVYHFVTHNLTFNHLK